MSNSELWSKLQMLQEQDLLSHADIEFGRFLSRLQGEVSDEVLLAACLTSYRFQQGDVCVILEEVAGKSIFTEAGEDADIIGFELEHWISRLEESHLVGRPGDYKPLILDAAHRLYLHKLWHYEQGLARNILRRCSLRDEKVNEELLADGLTRLFDSGSGDETDWQMIAAIVAIYHHFTVISGGPGTGKTSTVIRILALLLEQAADREFLPAIALAAPTGKAAARLQDSISSMKESLQVSDKIRRSIPVETLTLHKLLGARKNSAAYRYNKDNPLPYDLIIVDEASMVDQALMGKLMDALLDDTRVILLGDKDQLASVEAGSVMGDICAVDENRFSQEFAQKLKNLAVEVPAECVVTQGKELTDHIILLKKSYRFKGDSGIALLAGAVNRGDDENVLQLLSSEAHPEIRFIDDSRNGMFVQTLEELAVGYFNRIAGASTFDDAIKAYNSFRVLAPHRKGLRGVEYLNQFTEHILNTKGFISGYQNWYFGMPVIINENDYALGLYNGDIGLCMYDGNRELKFYISQEDEVRAVSPGRLPGYNLAYALTVHKSQGSEFDKVLLVLPDRPSRVLTRELLYTAITRARSEVHIIGNPDVLRVGVKTRLKRASGLQDQLWLKSK